MTWGELKNFINSNMPGHEGLEVCFRDSRYGTTVVSDIDVVETDSDIKENYHAGSNVIILYNTD